jgi:hypothetical protein
MLKLERAALGLHPGDKALHRIQAAVKKRLTKKMNYIDEFLAERLHIF